MTSINTSHSSKQVPCICYHHDLGELQEQQFYIQQSLQASGEIKVFIKLKTWNLVIDCSVMTIKFSTIKSN